MEQQPLLPDACLAEEHSIGQLCHQVQRAALHADTSVLQAAEIQQLLHHIVQPPGLIVDDLQPLAVVLVGGVVQGHQGLHPAPDGGKRGAQFVRHRADELVLHLLGLFQTLSHLVDGAAQPVHLVVGVAGQGQTHIQFAPGDAGGGALHLPQRHHDAPHKVQSGHDREQQDRHRNEPTDDDGVFDLPLHQRQTGDQPQSRHVLGVVGHQRTGRHDHLAGLGAVHRHAQTIRRTERLFKVPAADDALRVRTAGGGDHAAVAVQQHELVFILIGKLFHHAPQRQTAADRRALGGIAGIHFQLTGHRGEPPVHDLLHTAVVAAGIAVQKHCFGQQHHQYGDEQIAPQPAAGDTASHNSVLLSVSIDNKKIFFCDSGKSVGLS